MTKDERLEINSAMVSLANAIIKHELTKELGKEFEHLSNVLIAIMDRSREKSE